MKAKDLLVQHDNDIAALQGELAALKAVVAELVADALDFEIDTDSGGRVILESSKDRPVGSPESPSEQTPPQAPVAAVSAEPDVSMQVGGSTEDQKAAYRAFVAERERVEQEQRGLVEQGDERIIAAPTVKQLALRRQLAKEIGWEHWTRSEEFESTPLPPDEARAAYLTGGPIWLVNYDRDFVKQQTMATRQRMVEDVMLTSVEAANELSADILKYEDSNDPSVATDAAYAEWDR